MLSIVSGLLICLSDLPFLTSVLTASLYVTSNEEPQLVSNFGLQFFSVDWTLFTTHSGHFTKRLTLFPLLGPKEPCFLREQLVHSGSYQIEKNCKMASSADKWFGKLPKQICVSGLSIL